MTAVDKNKLIQVYHTQPCCMATCICPQTHRRLTYSGAPRPLQPSLIVCSGFAEYPDWLAVPSFALSRPIPTPAWATGLLAVRSSLKPPRNRWSSWFHLHWKLSYSRQRQEELCLAAQCHFCYSSPEPPLWGIFTIFHTQRRDSWITCIWQKTCLPSWHSSRFVLSGWIFWNAKAQGAELHLHFCILKSDVCIFQGKYLWHFCVSQTEVYLKISLLFDFEHLILKGLGLQDVIFVLVS